MAKISKERLQRFTTTEKRNKDEVGKVKPAPKKTKTRTKK